MPYIREKQRLELLQREPESAGELNYVITTLCNRYLSKVFKDTGLRIDNSYSDYNEVIGVLECAKQEFYRRVVCDYEDRKKSENGDVYE